MNGLVVLLIKGRSKTSQRFVDNLGIHKKFADWEQVYLIRCLVIVKGNMCLVIVQVTRFVHSSLVVWGLWVV